MDSIILPSQLNVQNIKYGTPRTLDNGGKMIYLAYNNGPIVLQTPEMIAPFGLSKWDNDKGDSSSNRSSTKYSLNLSFKGMDGRPLLKTFYDKMSELDDKLIEDGQVNSFDWLKKKGVSKEVVKELYTKLVSYPIDKSTGEVSTKYPPTFKLSIPWRDGAFQCEVYDSKRKLVDLQSLETKGARVTAIIQCLGLWAIAGKFGCTWKVIQLKVVPPASIKGFAFKPDTDKVSNDESDDDTDNDEEHDKVEQTNTLVDSSDDDDDLDAKN